MGTKRELLDTVAEAVESASSGIFLDAFSGMCSVGERIGTKRQVWSNDTQFFASQVATALFTSSEAPLSALRAAEIFFPKFAAHQKALTAILAPTLDAEASYEASPTFEISQLRFGLLEKSLNQQTKLLARKHYVLFSRLYANSYIGVRQAIEVDSIIASLNQTVSSALLPGEQTRWMKLALGRSILKCAATTGHFAQYLTPNRTSYKKLIHQRNKSLWTEWLHSIDLLSPVGDRRWRLKNQVFNEDSRKLINRLKGAKVFPNVIYADPPYTDDQYSRFYHLLDTLLLYDYPPVSGKGRYRHRRFRTSFSLISTVHEAFTDFLGGVAAIGSDLILSYPSNGLLHKAGHNPLTLLRKHFATAECFRNVPHRHSTMGASKGFVKEDVVESIYIAKGRIR